ncbi:alpha-amylase family glycosyl hydrolase [Cohnella caldifontis]|uniref:alpha-amylase family glycosyl hydrolase n=1 Tax=Cohnella caldifontis TaxID=3027471 RepID=UPI0023EC93D4|nr:alpha-amylase family glycosyl hydrolase [Cohnella sp. YIM B05605]
MSRSRRRRAAAGLAAALLGGALASCSGANGGDGQASSESHVYYEIFVRSFADSNGDGIGDLNGITAKLDYLNDGKPGTGNDLGVDGIWLMPINPSPSYHGYDVTDYENVNPDYGTMEDLKKLVSEAHKRGIKVIMDLVVNHTSSQHPWFVDSASGKDSAFRNWYVWAEDAGREPSGSSAAGASEAWHLKKGSHYLGIFWDGMPDLNFDEPAVRQAVIDAGKFWLESGIDGFRIDAAKHVYENLNTDKNQKTLNRNVAWWQEFRQAMQKVKPDVYIVGEVWDSTARVGPFLKGMDSAFNFDLAANLIGAARNESASNVGFTLSRIHEFYGKHSDGKFVEAPFLSNHDQTRVMTALQGNADHAKMAASLLLTMPGNAFVYYGEELGMTGAKPDERIREPFPWKRAPGAPEETTWEPATGRGDGSVSVEAEDGAADSLLNRYRALIGWRQKDAALRGNAIGEYEVGNKSVMAYTRGSGEEKRLVLHNLSGKPQSVEIAATKAEPTAFAKVLFTTDESARLKGGMLELPPYTSVVLMP